MVIGYMSFTLSTNPPISSSAASSEFNSQATNSVNSGAVNSALLATQRSNDSFVMSGSNTSYVDPTNGQLYGTGRGYNGNLGLGYDEDGIRIGNQESFTPLYKSGDASQPFINPIDWYIGYWMGIVLDADGKVWTAGQQSYGQLGNGVLTNGTDWLLERQYTFEMVEIDGSYDYNAVRVGGNTSSSFVMLDDGTLWGAGSYAALGLARYGEGSYARPSEVGGEPTEIGSYYHTYIKLDLSWMPEGTSIIDISLQSDRVTVLLDDGSLWKPNGNTSGGWSQFGSNVISFDFLGVTTYYVDSLGDVYYSSSVTGEASKLLSAGEYEGTIDSVYTGATGSGWAYLTTDGDVYFCNTPGGTEFFKIAENVIYFDLGGYGDNQETFGAITSSGEFKLWGYDYQGNLGNGDTEGSTPGWDASNPSMDAFYSEKATVSTPTTDGNNVTPPAVDENGELEKDEDGNNVAIIPTLSTPAPAKF